MTHYDGESVPADLILPQADLSQSQFQEVQVHYDLLSLIGRRIIFLSTNLRQVLLT